MHTYLRVINLAGTEERIERVIPRQYETSKVDEKLAGDVKENQEEVQAEESKDDVDLGDRGLLLEIVESWIFGELE